MQGEHRFDRLKRDVEDVKNQPRGPENPVPTAAEGKRHRAQLADDASKEQLKVQTAFRKQGEHMQVGPWCAVLLAPCCGKVMLWREMLDMSIQAAIRSRWHTCRPRICVPAGCCQLGL